MKVSLFTYLTEIRLNHAVNDLVTTSLTIEQIAANNGFANSRYFVSSFKKQFGMLPKDYRKKQKKENAAKPSAIIKYSDYLLMEQHEFLNILGKYLKPVEKAKEIKTMNYASRPASIYGLEINSQNYIKSLIHNFKSFTGVGRAKELLMHCIQSELETFQKEVGFRYIKFHGILDDSMMLYNEDKHGNPYLTFTYVDAVIDYLQSIHLRPLIELSFMPRKLAASISKTIFYTPAILSEPNNYTKWMFLITNLTRHFIDRYGLEEVRTWKFSFWNSPFRPNIFAFSTNDISYDLYKVTRSCVKECDEQLTFGNPSFSSLDFNSGEIHGFMEFCRKNNCYPDFYNINCYPVKETSGKELASLLSEQKGSIEKNIVTLANDPDYLTHAISNFRASVINYPKVPICITEWASTTSHRDWLNDTCYRSSFIIKNVLENYDLVDSFGNWCLSDTLEELPLSNEEFHGELGLFTSHGIKKPAYYAYVFLNKLFDSLVASGNGYFITTNQKGDYSIILYNYIHISPLYAQGILFNVNFIDRYNAFNDPSSLNFDFKLTHLVNGFYSMTEQIINRDYGSAFDEWVRMGALPLVTEEEINILKGRSMPMINKRNIEVTNNTLRYLADLKPHEIRLIKIKKQLW